MVRSDGKGEGSPPYAEFADLSAGLQFLYDLEQDTFDFAAGRRWWNAVPQGVNHDGCAREGDEDQETNGQDSPEHCGDDRSSGPR